MGELIGDKYRLSLAANQGFNARKYKLLNLYEYVLKCDDDDIDFPSSNRDNYVIISKKIGEFRLLQDFLSQDDGLRTRNILFRAL